MFLGGWYYYYCCTALIAVVVHDRFVGWVTYIGGWLMGRWFVLYLRASQAARGVNGWGQSGVIGG